MLQRVIVAAMIVSAGVLHGQELEPRAFSPGPTGLNIVGVSAGYSSGDLVFDSSIPIEGATAKTSTVAIGYQRFFSMLGQTAKFAATAAEAKCDAKGYVQEAYHERHFRGLTDPRVGFSVIFMGAPAMEAREYAKFRPHTLAGFSFVVSPPLGAYERDKLLNAGLNRWTFRPQLGIARYQGPWTLEGTLGAQLFTDNHEFMGSSTQSQDPIYSLQLHCGYTFRPQLWVAAGATAYRGGGTAIDDVARPGFQNNSRYGVSASMPVAKGQSISINYSRGLSTRLGSNYDTVIVSWAARWMNKPAVGR